MSRVHGAAGSLGQAAEAVPSEKLQEMLARSQRLETLGRMTGAIAHDFNNLLLIVFGATELARLATRDPRVEVELGRIEEASLRAAGLVRQLLAFARGRPPTEGRPIRLGEVVSHLVRLIDLSLGRRIDFSHRIQEGLWSIVADPSQIEQLVLNLVINAREAMPMGGRVELELENVPGTPYHPMGDHVRMTLRDNGVGMDADTLEHAFEPFFSTKANGNGLGLSTCQHIVEKCGGTIAVTTSNAVGTEFVICFPRAPET